MICFTPEGRAKEDSGTSRTDIIKFNKERWNLIVWNITNVLPNAWSGRGKNRPFRWRNFVVSFIFLGFLGFFS